MATLSHAEARSILDQAWRRVHGRAPTAGELAYTQAIALLETGYGRAGQFAKMAEQGQFNWGALEQRMPASGICPPGTAPGIDQGNVCFLVFPDDVSAAARFVQTLTRRHWPVLQVMSSGSPEDVARAMRSPPAYYTGPSGSEDTKVNYYASAIRNALSRIGTTVTEGGLGLVPWAILGASAAGLGYWYYKRSR